MDIEKLKAAGFVETTYPDQPGIFWTKHLPIADMPYASEHIADGFLVSETDTAIVETVPDVAFKGGGVHMLVLRSDYAEDIVAVDSEEGLALLRDAGVEC